jgi:hypothetical protein
VSDRHRALEQDLSSRGLTTIDVLGDGNCFYRAACYGLYGCDTWHADLRRRNAEYVMQAGSLLEGLVSAANNTELFSKYVEAMLTDGESVGEEAVVALTNVCKREVHIFTAHVGPIVYKPANDDVSGEPVSLAFFEPGHYRAVVPVNVTSHLN